MNVILEGTFASLMYPLFFFFLKVTKDMIIPRCGGIPYEDIDMVFLVNPKQVIAYMINKPDLHMYDCFLGHDNKMIFVFRKADTYELYKKWCAHELPVVTGGK